MHLIKFFVFICFLYTANFFAMDEEDDAQSCFTAICRDINESIHCPESIHDSEGFGAIIDWQISVEEMFGAIIDSPISVAHEEKRPRKTQRQSIEKYQYESYTHQTQQIISAEYLRITGQRFANSDINALRATYKTLRKKWQKKFNKTEKTTRKNKVSR